MWEENFKRKACKAWPKNNTSFFHGAFKKYSAEINSVQYILKMGQSDFPELPLVEWISNKIYKGLGILVADFYMIKFENSIDTFVTKNFMDRSTRKNLIHIYHFIGDGFDYNCEAILKVISEKCGSYIDIKNFIEMTMCDSLVGNHDRHGRNIALIQKDPALFQMAPVYDNPSYIGIEDDVLLGADLNPKGKIFTSLTNEPTLKDYVYEFTRLGFAEIVDGFIAKIKEKNEFIVELIEASNLSSKRKNAFLKIINKRIEEIK